MGVRAEQFKSFLVATHEPIRIVLLLMLLVFGFFALRSWKNANDMAGATNARLDGILDKFEAKVDAFKIENVNEVLTSVKGRVEGLAPLEKGLTDLTVSTGKNTDKLTNAAVNRINQLGENLTSLKGVTDEGQKTVAASGKAIADISKATTTLMEKYGLTGEEATRAIKTASEQTGKSLEALAKQIADPRWSTAADNLVKATGEANGTLVDFHKDLHATMEKMPAIAADVQKTSHTIATFSKVSIVVSIISRLASALIPGLLN